MPLDPASPQGVPTPRLPDRSTNPGDSPDVAKAAKLWGEAAIQRSAGGAPHGWLDASLSIEEVQRRVTGHAQMPWLPGVVAELQLPPGGHWLSLGSGSAGTEIDAGRRGLFGSMRAVDASKEALDLAQRSAIEAGVTSIRFDVADLDRLVLEESAYDAVLFNMSLHHVSNLEGLLTEVERSLRPGGTLLLNEYVGPARFQFGPLQTALVEEILAVLPERLRRDVTTGSAKTRYVVRPTAFWLEVDPTEAVRSDEIVSEVSKRFDVVLRRDYGGTILHLALENIARNFESSDEDVAILRLLFLFERVLVSLGDLGNDFTVMAARRYGQPPVPGRPPIGSPDPGSGLGAMRKGDRLPRELELDAELRELRDRDRLLREILASRGWKLLQALRSLVGRRW